jgi:uncharacterized protein (TIGR02453 family)
MKFPKNRKNPYKINLWANISIWWRESELAWYYIHIQNNESFFSWEICNPSTKVTNLIRKNIYKNWNQFEKIIKNKDFIRVFWGVFSYHTPLKKLSKEFNSNQTSTKYLQYKDRLINKKISNKEILSWDIGNKILEYAKIAKKLNDFINNI